MNKEKHLLLAETSLLGQLAKGTSISFLLGIVGYIFMFLFKFVTAKHYGPEDLGLFEMTNTILLILIIFSTFGIPAGISRYIPLYKHQGEEMLLSGYIRFILLGTLSISVCISIVLFFFASTITQFFNFPSQLEPLIKIASFIIPLRTLSHIFRKIFVAQKKIFFQTFSESILEKFSLLILLFFCIIFHLPIFFVVLALLISTIISLFFDIYIFTKKIDLPKKTTSLYRRQEWLAFSIPLLFSGFFTFFIQWSDNILVGKLMSASLLGIYSLAYSLGDFVGFLQIPFITMFNPLSAEKYATQDKNAIELLFKKTVSWLFILGMGFVTLFVLFGKELLSFFGSSFSLGYTPLIIISSGLLIYNIFSISESILILHKKTRFVFFVNFLTASLNISLNIIFIHSWGIIGAAAASAIAINIKGLITFFYARKKESISIPQMTILKAFAAASIAIAFDQFSKNFINDSFQFPLIIPIIAMSTYIVMLFVFRIITLEDKKMLLLFIRRLRRRLYA